ncbi:MAG: hypothetical protein D6714_07235 [Bacteroidetes bacterium]|nr:MAG: hypothetical protein D6714_07235 [Bacteroidota bacterium]
MLSCEKLISKKVRKAAFQGTELGFGASKLASEVRKLSEKVANFEVFLCWGRYLQNQARLALRLKSPFRFSERAFCV